MVLLFYYLLTGEMCNKLYILHILNSYMVANLCTILDLLPCDRVPIQQCLSGDCNQCLKIKGESAVEPDIGEIGVSPLLTSTMPTI